MSVARRTLYFDSPKAPRQPRLDLASSGLDLGSTAHTPRKTSGSKSIGRHSPVRNEFVADVSSPSRRRKHADRFIPNRANSHTQRSKVETVSGAAAGGPGSAGAVGAVPGGVAESSYNTTVAEACGIALNTRILEFQPAAPQSSKPIDLRSQYNRPLNTGDAQTKRRVAQAPERVLDAPGLIDDYYLNLLDWSASNQVAIALERSIYVWDASSGSVSCLFDAPASTGYISGVKWSGDGAYLSVGLADGDVQIWDVETQSKLRSMSGHTTRVGSLAWNEHVMSSGCRDGSIWNHDVRIADHKIAELRNHRAEVCGLEWRGDGAQLASGGNDNVVNIWDARSTCAPKFSKTNHKAAVKAISWCPWQTNLLATGGGSADKHIHFWNATTGARVNSIDAGSQVTSLKWSHSYREIVSAHGFPDNNLTVWAYPSLTRTADIAAHDSRVLHSALSPDGQTLATCASDENLKFWRIFEAGKKAAGGSSLASKDMGKSMMIR